MLADLQKFDRKEARGASVLDSAHCEVGLWAHCNNV